MPEDRAITEEDGEYLQPSAEYDYFGGQGGVGLEFRISRRVALNIDAPAFIRHRTDAEIAKAKDTLLSDLPDQLARNANLPENTPADDANRGAKDREPWLVMIGVCTHLGCIPKGQAVGDYRGEYGGWFCPCHGSQYDTAGRVRIGPAPENLAIPPYKFVSDQKIKIG